MFAPCSNSRAVTVATMPRWSGQDRISTFSEESGTPSRYVGVPAGRSLSTTGRTGVESRDHAVRDASPAACSLLSTGGQVAPAPLANAITESAIICTAIADSSRPAMRVSSTMPLSLSSRASGDANRKVR